MRVVVIDPDTMAQKVLRFILHEGGYSEVVLTSGAEDGLPAALQDDVSLVIVRAELPDDAGVPLCRDLRDRRYHGPIVFLTNQIDLSRKLAAFDAGADDYILEPLAPQELLARVQAIARRYAQEDYQPLGTVLRVGDAELSVTDLMFRCATQAAVRLTPTEMRILECLMRNPGIAVHRETLIERVWGYDFFGESNRIDVYIRRLRHKIERDPSQPEFLHTVRGIGYNFRPRNRQVSESKDVLRPAFDKGDLDCGYDAAGAN